jgi:hypothetical protein
MSSRKNLWISASRLACMVSEDLIPWTSRANASNHRAKSAS